MTKYFLDAGTTFSKILKVNGDKDYSIIRTTELKNLSVDFEISTGHSYKGNHFENEVIALSFGAKSRGLDDGVILDLGSRDSKWVKFTNSNFVDMDWNTNCASATGATIEMLLSFYKVKAEDIPVSESKYPVTCGIFGLEKIMEDVSNGIEPKIAIAKFIHGVAYNAYNFTKKPDKIYLSGGFCENQCFIESLKFYTNVIPIGRYVLVDGLFEMHKNNK